MTRPLYKELNVSGQLPSSFCVDSHISHLCETSNYELAMRSLEFLSPLLVLQLASAAPTANIRRATAPNPNTFEASKAVEASIPQLLDHAHQSIQSGKNVVGDFAINGPGGHAQIFDDIPVPFSLLTLLIQECNLLHFQHEHRL
jgi:hypothetical protein